MGLFDDTKPKMDETDSHVESQPDTDGLGQGPADITDDVLERGDEFTDKVPTDLDNTLISSTEEIKGKVDD